MSSKDMPMVDCSPARKYCTPGATRTAFFWVAGDPPVRVRGEFTIVDALCNETAAYFVGDSATPYTGPLHPRVPEPQESGGSGGGECNCSAAEIEGFAAEARAQIEAALIAGANISIAYAGSGATRAFTIASSGGGGGATDHYTTHWMNGVL